METWLRKGKPFEFGVNGEEWRRLLLAGPGKNWTRVDADMSGRRDRISTSTRPRALPEPIPTRIATSGLAARAKAVWRDG